MDRSIKHIEDSIVIDTLLADKTLNFIAFVISPWHVISLEASLLYLRALGMDMKGIVCIIKHPKTGYAVNIEDLVLDEVAMVAFTENAYLYPHRKPTMSQWQVFLSHRKQNLNIYVFSLFLLQQLLLEPYIHKARLLHQVFFLLNV